MTKTRRYGGANVRGIALPCLNALGFDEVLEDDDLELLEENTEKLWHVARTN